MNYLLIRQSLFFVGSKWSPMETQGLVAGTGEEFYKIFELINCNDTLLLVVKLLGRRQDEIITKWFQYDDLSLNWRDVPHYRRAMFQRDASSNGKKDGNEDDGDGDGDGDGASNCPACPSGSSRIGASAGHHTQARAPALNTDNESVGGHQQLRRRRGLPLLEIDEESSEPDAVEAPPSAPLQSLSIGTMSYRLVSKMQAQ